MKRILSIIICCLSIFLANAQTNIKFNGATFGNTLENFIEGFPKKPYIKELHSNKIYNPDVYNGYRGYVQFNSQDCETFIFTSRKSNKVFRTITHKFSEDMQNDLMLLVKTLENKYGGHREEKKEDLGEIITGEYGDSSFREMLALYYTIYNNNNQPIGEVRISCAPVPRDNGKGKIGYIELSYTDYNTSKLAADEYNSLMNDTL